MLVKIVQ
jgi:hypothetical protein